MSMTLYLLRLNEAQSEQLTDDPELVEPVLEAATQHAKKSAASPLGELAPALDLHKSWHIMHYLFTGEPWGGSAPANALLGGEEIGEDVGYGPARLHDSTATKAFAAFLAKLTEEELFARFDMARMMELDIYCAGGESDEEQEECREDINAYFPELRGYVAQAAAAHDSLLVWME